MHPFLVQLPWLYPHDDMAAWAKLVLACKSDFTNRAIAIAALVPELRRVREWMGATDAVA